MTETILRTSKLTKIYPSNNLKAVDELDLSLFRGEVLGLLGPNGAGKTTLIRMLVGLLSPTEGSIIFEGEENGDNFLQKIEQIGYVPQDVVIWEILTVISRTSPFPCFFLSSSGLSLTKICP